MFQRYPLRAALSLVAATATLASAANAQSNAAASAVAAQASSQLAAAASNQDNANQQLEETIRRGIEFLRQRGQASDGSYSKSAGIGPTALAVSALIAVDVPLHDAAVARGLAFLHKHVQADGGIYHNQSLHRNYDTCIAMVAFAAANRDGKYDVIVERAEAFVKGMQWDESEDRDASDTFYGGAGYGKHQRPDLSNTAFLVDALHEIGNGEDDEAMQKALTFISRCQNLETPHNSTTHAAKVNDGGFYYTVANGGESKAGETVTGGLRSYGSMTYAGLKSMIYAGVKTNDPRVQAALGFLSKNYNLETNPGLGQQGLFYYYHTMAKALHAVGQNEFVDASGDAHNWRQELVSKLAGMQQADGSWVNETTRWMEGDPNLVTAYSLLALAHCRQLDSK